MRTIVQIVDHSRLSDERIDTRRPRHLVQSDRRSLLCRHGIQDLDRVHLQVEPVVLEHSHDGLEQRSAKVRAAVYIVPVITRDQAGSAMVSDQMAASEPSAHQKKCALCIGGKEA